MLLANVRFPPKLAATVFDPLQTLALGGMLSGMDAVQQNKLLLLLTMVTGLALAIVAVSLAVAVGDPVSPLFRHVLTIQVIAALIIWFALAWAARRLTIGGPPQLSINSRGMLLFGGSRVALLIAVIFVMIGWGLSVVLRLELATAFVRALVLLVVVTAFTGIIGGAFLNSVVAAKHWRTGRH